MPKTSSEPLIKTSEAIKRIETKWPHISVAGVRKALSDGTIPSVRMSAAPKSRMLVKWSDVRNYMDALNRN